MKRRSDEMKRVLVVLLRLHDTALLNEDLAGALAERLDDFLDVFYEEGLLGPNGEQDPRGNQTRDTFTMEYVSGIDA